MKKRVVASRWSRSVEGALSTLAGYEAMNIIRKGQIRWLPKTDSVGQVRLVERTVGKRSLSQILHLRRFRHCRICSTCDRKVRVTT